MTAAQGLDADRPLRDHERMLPEVVLVALVVAVIFAARWFAMRRR